MLVDVYGLTVPMDPGYGPHMRSFDHEFLLRPGGTMSDRVPTEGILMFKEMFGELDLENPDPKNGLKSRVGFDSSRLEGIKAQLAEDREIIGDRRGKVIDRYGVGSNENTEMMRAQEELGGMGFFLKRTLDAGSDILAVTHNAKPRRVERSIGRQEQEGFGISGGCAAYSARLSTVDRESGTYTGKVTWADLIERCPVPDNEFVVHPLPEEFGFGSDKVWVRSRDVHLTGGHHFGFGGDLNMGMRRYIMPLIEEAESSAVSAGE